MMGEVILVGAGPGDPGLLTVRGREALEIAQVVLYDRLVGEEILALLPPEAEIVDVGKQAGRHPIPQEEINALLVLYAKQGKRVVRLKGGDPYLFGRGAEELEALAAEGIPFEVVPGVTSALAAPAYGGIPVSHRDMASSVHILTGHPRHGGEAEIHYEGLVSLGGTLIFLMGVGAIAEIVAGLTGAGMSPEQPCALIENGTRPNQRRLCCSLAELVTKAKEEAFRPPSVLVVGKVCTLAQELDWFGRRSLHGICVVVTRARESAGSLSAKLRALGAWVTEYPCIRTEALPVEKGIFDCPGGWDWFVFTSPVGARMFFEELVRRGRDIRALAGVNFAAVGTKTAAELTTRGLLPEIVPDTFDGKHLATALLERAKPGQRILLYRAEAGASALADTLRAAGLAVRDVAAYRTVYDNPNAAYMAQRLAEGQIQYVTFTSASTVWGFAQSLPEQDRTGFVGVCIGEETAEAARALGMEVIVSERATLDALVTRLLEHQEALHDT